MALGFLARAMQAGLSKLGEPALLDGVDVGKVAIERAVDIYDGSNRSVDSFGGLPQIDDGQYVARHDIATFKLSDNPQIGQTLVHPDGTFQLTRRLTDDGYTVDFVIASTT